MKFQVVIVLMPGKHAPLRFQHSGGELLTLRY